MKLQVVIYSKDRACQLDGLMRSMVDNVVDWDKCKLTTIFYASNPAFKKGYDIVRNKSYGRYYRMVQEINKTFKQFTVEAIDPNIPYTMFLVDDDVFIRRWDMHDNKIESLEATNVACVSLRMDHRYDYCYTEGRAVTIPPIVGDRWQWKGQQGDWGYPMSLDGHIFRTSEISALLQRLEYRNPNTLEGILAGNCIDKPLMVSYPKAKLLNLPVNRVQTVNQNRAGVTCGVTAQQLNDWFLQGKSLQVDQFYNVETANAPHYELPLVVQ